MSRSGEGGISRRDFLAGATAGAAGLLWIDVSIPRVARGERSPGAAADGPVRRSLDAEEWLSVEAITARILPTDDTPGAREAGCVGYIDRALAEEDASARPRYRAALAALEDLCQGRAGSSFSDWSPERQDALLHELEGGEVAGWSAPEAPPDAFFETIRMHTILGFVLDPRYGGNRNYAGWRTVGFPGAVHHLGGSRPEQMIGTERFPPIWERADPVSAVREHSAPPASKDRPGGDGD